MLFKTSRSGVKTAFEYFARLPFTKKLLYRLSEFATGRSVVFFSLHRLLSDNEVFKEHPHLLNKTALTIKEARYFFTQIQKTLPFVSITTALEYLKGNQILQKSIAVLLVEAPYRETFKNLLPLIDELNIPFAVSLGSHALSTGEPPWVDEVVFRILSTAKEELVANFIDRSFALTSTQERLWAANHLVENLSHCPPKMLQDRLHHLRELLHETALPPRSERIASIPELIKLSAHPHVSFVVGGYYQMPFFDLNGAEAHREIIGAKEELSYLFGEALVPVFIYPEGLIKNQNLQLITMMMEGGYIAAFTRSIGLARPGDNMFRLPCLPLGFADKNAQFELQGLFEAIDEFLLVTLAKDKEL